MTQIQFLKVVDVLPAKIKRDSVYFLYHTDTQKISIYITDSLANPRQVASDIVYAQVIAALGFTPISAAQTGFEFTQAAPSSIWNITHNLGFKPNVLVIDTSNNECHGIINQISINSLTITFSAAFSGIAYLS